MKKILFIAAIAALACGCCKKANNGESACCAEDSAKVECCEKHEGCCGEKHEGCCGEKAEGCCAEKSACCGEKAEGCCAEKAAGCGEKDAEAAE